MSSNLKGALRSISARPAFSSLIVLTLALGIGLNSAVFSIVDGMLFRAMSYKDSDRLYRILEFSQGAGSGEGPGQLYFGSYQGFLAFREGCPSFDQVEAMASFFYNITGGKSPESLPGAEVSDGFFTMLGAKAALGRLFVPEDNKPGAPPVAVLGQQVWKRRFGGDPGALGRSIMLNGKAHTIVGVMEPGFFYRVPSELWVPLTINPSDPPYPPGTRYLIVSGHMRPGANLETAKREAQTVMDQLGQQYPATHANWGTVVHTVRDNLLGDMKPALLTLLAASAFLLLIACSNVANLLLNRVVRQRGELALRTALGASRGALIRQIVTESTLLSLLGGALGLALATAFIRILPKISPTQVPLLREVHIDSRVILFSILVSLLCGLLPGLFVAIRGSRLDLFSQLKDIGNRSSSGVESRRLQSGLVVSGVALTLVLLVCCGLVLKSFARLSATSPGFVPENVLMAEITLPSWKYQEPEQIRTFWRNLLPRVESLPGVVAAGTTHVLPLNDFPTMVTFDIPGRVATSESEVLNANFRKVTPGFFSAMRTQLISGRVFDNNDDENHPLVAILSREMARRFWPDGDPLGKQIIRKRPTGDQMLTVVGILGDTQDKAPGTPFGNAIYVPFWQDPKSNKPSVHLMVRTAGEPLGLAQAITREVQAIDPDQPIDKIASMDQWVYNSLSRKRFSTWILTIFAVLAAILSALGIYSVLSYNVSRRHQEMGVRLAFGARARDIIRMIVMQGMSLTGIGIVIGLILAVALSRLLASQLYQVKPSDPVVFVGIIVGLSAVAFLACYLPARRAARVDPIRSLKQE
jgi:putative ABC transport system permease protein